jgi:hypothetical protein
MTASACAEVQSVSAPRVLSPRLIVLLVFFSVFFARAAPADVETNELFATGVKALHEGRAVEAIAALEALADRGVVNAAASYDRGLAYAMRIRIRAEVPGDLGRAAHGFEEARELASDPTLYADASRALVVIRSEVARRRTRAGQPVDVDPGRSLARIIARMIGEDAWSAISVAASATLALGLFVRWLGRAKRVRVAGGVTAGISAPALAIATAMTLASRNDRANLREAVVVVTSASPMDSRGITLPGTTPLPEGARVEVVDARGAQTRVRFGKIDAWIPSNAVRELARTSVE